MLNQTLLSLLRLSLNHIQLRVQLATTDSANHSINCGNQIGFVTHNDCCFATFKFNETRTITNRQQHRTNSIHSPPAFDTLLSFNQSLAAILILAPSLCNSNEVGILSKGSLLL